MKYILQVFQIIRRIFFLYFLVVGEELCMWIELLFFVCQVLEGVQVLVLLLLGQVGGGCLRVLRDVLGIGMIFGFFFWFWRWCLVELRFRRSLGRRRQRGCRKQSDQELGVEVGFGYSFLVLFLFEFRLGLQLYQVLTGFVVQECLVMESFFYRFFFFFRFVC